MFPLKDNAPTRSFPLVTVALIVANVAVFVWESARLEERVVRYGYYPCDLAGSCVAAAKLRELPWFESAFSSMFLHGGWVHLLGNMLFLWIFGNNVEDALGKLRYLGFYVLGGLAATALQTAVTLHYSGAAGESIPNVGASGAIAAVLGAYVVLLPRAKVFTWIFPFFLREIPAVFFLGIWILLQLWQGGSGLSHPDETGGVAVFAHIGGFAFGMLTAHALAVRRPLQPRW
jgi:membrane associated rhomboid family serine protease